jgi:hypothetical protein
MSRLLRPISATIRGATWSPASREARTASQRVAREQVEAIRLRGVPSARLHTRHAHALDARGVRSSRFKRVSVAVTSVARRTAGRALTERQRDGSADGGGGPGQRRTIPLREMRDCVGELYDVDSLARTAS